MFINFEHVLFVERGIYNKAEFIYNIMDRNLIFLDANSLLENVFELIQLNKSKLMLVMENNEVAGALDIENLMEFISTI